MEKAEASFKDSNVTITMKAGKTLTKEDLEKAFKDSQFSVTSFETVAEEEEKKEGDEGKELKRGQAPFSCAFGGWLVNFWHGSTSSNGPGRHLLPCYQPR